MKQSEDDRTEFEVLCARALERRRALVAPGSRGAFRAFSGSADGVDGIYIDVYAEGAVLIEYEGRPPRWWNAHDGAAGALRALAPAGVRAVYHKPFAKDRSRLGGQLPECVTDPKPAAGESLPESLLIREGEMNLEVRMYDGLSTGLFLDQRENRARVLTSVAKRRERAGAPVSVLNTFAYTCAFSVAAALGGATTTSVDVSARYLEWGRRNFAHNGLDASAHRFAKMGTMEFFAYAARKNLTYDFIILDPPSFAAGSKKKDVRPWSSTSDYARLVGLAGAALKEGGAIFASTNTAELCLPGRLEREIVKGLGREPRWLRLPPAPEDFSREKNRFAACLFTM